MIDLDKELDRTKAEVFIGSNAAFFGSLLCSLDFVWDNSIPTACTNDKQIMWNSDWFRTLEPKTRVTILVHELWHTARLHMVRRAGRNPKVWNQACIAGDVLITMGDKTKKPIKNIKQYDLILGEDKKEHIVLEFIPKGIKEVIELEFENGTKLQCTPDHLIGTKNGYKRADQLDKRDKILLG